MMAVEKTSVLLIGPPRPVIFNGLNPVFELVKFFEAKDRDKFLAEVGPRVRGMAVAATSERIDGAFMTHFPRLELVSSFGVGYDHVDAAWAGAHGITVTNTPDVLTEEVADTALGLLLCTVREFPEAERHVRAGKWLHENYPLSKATLRNRTVGLVGMGRIGQAIARRLDAMQVPVVYHSRRPAAGVSYYYYPKLLDMARDVDVLLVITPGGAETKHLINAEVLKALGREGILINMSRGSVLDERAPIKALQDGTIMWAAPERMAQQSDTTEIQLASTCRSVKDCSCPGVCCSPCSSQASALSRTRRRRCRAMPPKRWSAHGKYPMPRATRPAR